MSSKVSISRSVLLAQMTAGRQADTPRVGFGERQFRWKQLRAVCAQTMLTNPSIDIYLKCRNTKTIAGLLSQLHGILCRIVQDIQEIVDRVPSITPPVAETARRMIEETLSGGGTIDVQGLRAAVIAEVAPSATPQIRAKRAQSGATAERVQSLIRECVTRFRELTNRVADLSAEDLPSGIQNIAVEPVLQKLHAALALDPSTERTVAVAASMGAVEMYSRTISRSVKVSEEAATPVQFSSKVRSTTLTTSVSAELLGISPGDVIRSAASEATVVSVQGKVVTLSAPLPSGPIIIKNQDLENLTPFSSILGKIISLRSGVLQRPLNLTNRPAAVDYCKGVAQLAVAIAPLTRDAEAAASQLSIDIVGSDDLIQDLYALRFNFAEETRLQADELLRLLKEEGFFAAARSVGRGSYYALLTDDSRVAASDAAATDETLGFFVSLGVR
jgi:hypothetical protein